MADHRQALFTALAGAMGFEMRRRCQGGCLRKARVTHSCVCIEGVQMQLGYGSVRFCSQNLSHGCCSAVPALLLSSLSCQSQLG